MASIFGNTTGLGPSALAALERVKRRRIPADRITTPELLKSLADASRETHRQVGALIHRSGEIDTVIVGDAARLLLPNIGRLRAAQGRFRGLRLVHTHLFGEPLTRDDLTDLTRLRLDLVAALQLSPAGEPRTLTWAYNVPTHGIGDSPYHVVPPAPVGQPEPNFAELIASLEDEFARSAGGHAVQAKDGRAMLIHVSKKLPGAQQRARARLRELESLAETAGVAVVEQVLQLRDEIDPKFVLGRGRLEEVIISAIDLDVQTLIFDCDLSPAQISGIASHTDLRVVDRTQLILDIFAQRAETRDGKAQVELAQLRYALPRLGTRDDALSRLTGGIGGRGPGETKLEIGRRRARERIQRLEQELKILARQRAQRRRRRERTGVPVVAIVGYTNAGKSTLLNTLTEAGVLAENKLFATLDTRARQLTLPSGRQVILTDTVGFIREMPKSLLTAFRATFEEAADADLLLEVVDASDADHLAHMETTDRLLEQLDLENIPRLRAFNKADRMTPDDLEHLAAEEGSQGLRGQIISALDRNTTHELLCAIETRLALPAEPELPPSAREYSEEWGEWLPVPDAP